MKSLSTRLPGRFLTAVFVGFALTAGASAFAQDDFEGRVKMRMSDGSEQQSIEYFVKGDQMRVEVEDPRAQGGAMIMDMAEKEVRVVIPEQKMYMTMPLPDIPQGETEEQEKPEPTGETRTILDYEAEQYRIEHDGKEYEIWATDELGAFGALRVPGGGQPGATSPLSGAMAGQQFFPLLIIERSNGRESTRIEVTEVEKMELEESLFEVPSDYRGMQLPARAPQ